jgi:hypothetical protein
MTKLRWTLVVLALSGLLVSCGRGDDDGDTSTQTTAPTGSDECEEGTLRATDVGVTANTITIEVMADVGSPLAPGLFQGNVDAIRAYARYLNDNGGLACRKVAVREWDSKLNADESKNGQIDACASAFALVGTNALFNPDVSTMRNCADKSGNATGLPDFAGIANDINELCNPTTYLAVGYVEECPIVTGRPRPFHLGNGAVEWYAEHFPSSHGVYLVPGDLPTTVQSATYLLRAIELAGFTFDATPKVSGRAEQAAFTPIVQTMRRAGSNVVFNGSADFVMVKMRKETKAQGYDGVKLWVCNSSCYTKAFRQAGAEVEGTYTSLSFLPFEEKDTNDELAAFVRSVGETKVDSFGAYAWQSAVLFKQAVDDAVAEHGLNGLTRANVLAAAEKVKNFDANGWSGRKERIRGQSPCFVILQLRGGEFHRVFPEKRGTLACDEDTLVTFDLDPAAEAAKIK